MRDPYTALPAPVTLSHEPSRRPLPGQQVFALKAAGYVEADLSPAEIARRIRSGVMSER